VKFTRDIQSHQLFSAREFFHQDVGDIGIALFIVLSGATVMVSMTGSFRVLGLFKHRILGIFPSYWVAYIAVITVLFLVNAGIPGDYPYWTFLPTLVGTDGSLGYLISELLRSWGVVCRVHYLSVFDFPCGPSRSARKTSHHGNYYRDSILDPSLELR
jgi:hypothetical protein